MAKNQQAFLAILPSSNASQELASCPCEGLSIELPEGGNPALVYPFGLHGLRSIPWKVHLGKSDLRLTSADCSGVARDSTTGCCSQCFALQRLDEFIGIQQRILSGTHENTAHLYQPIGGLIKIIRRKDNRISALRVLNLNTSKALRRRTKTVTDHKRFLMALASNKVDRLHAVIGVALRGRLGIHAIIDRLNEASKGLYKPKSFSDEEMLRCLLMLKIGSSRVAEIAHRAYSDPSVSTIRQWHISTPLVSCPGFPTSKDVCLNISSSFPSSGPFAYQPEQVRKSGYVLMIDELKVEERRRWDPKTNSFIGLCREHAGSHSLEFATLEDLEQLDEGLQLKKIHRAKEATVISVGVLPSTPNSTRSRIYAARPVLASGSCKTENAEDHARLLQTVVDACRSQQQLIGAQLFCLASDGEARRGRALITLTHKHQLASSSPIYPLIAPLTLFNKLVGDHDLTSDKDYKHIIKRMRSWLLRSAGIRVGNVELTVAIFAAHLRQNGLPSGALNSYLRPEDKQDVTLAANLLKAVWSLPLIVPADSAPGFAEQRKAIYLLGRLIYYTVSPYMDISLSLSEQLVRLSAASHLALYLFVKHETRSHFMNGQLYADLQIMIKNVFFCVAKQKELDNEGNFYIILLGTDRLETSFGTIRTMVGNDCHTDMLQLADRLTNTTLCQNIYAEHPEWEPTPRRLHLPSLDSSRELSQSTDHINPAAWQGNVSVKPVILQTKWKAGRKLIEELDADASSLFDRIEGDKLDVFYTFGSATGSSLYDNTEELDDGDEESENNTNNDTESDRSASSSPPGSDEEDSSHDMTLDDLAGIDTYKQKVETMILVPTSSESNSPGKPVFKARLLAASERSTCLLRGSADRLKRYANIARHATGTTTFTGDIMDSDGDISKATLTSGDPAVTIVKHQKSLFLAVIQINNLLVNSRSVASISLDVLHEPKVAIGFQIMCLKEMTASERESISEDWRSTGDYKIGSYRTEGRFIQCVDPAIFTRDSSLPCWAFTTSLLQELGAVLFSKLSKADRQILPTVSQSRTFPYRGSGGM
ncbi:hypothetical protein DL93DRAFT_2219257 [Clavulina sp. PMI_390]|nr:hypothetical protein DL93DRAFT_2219257 [Clavulina sp. PMI_390]